MFFAFTACSDDSASSPENIAGMNFAFNVESLDDLPNCTVEREQDTAFIRDGNKIYVCENDRWEYLRAIIDSVKTVGELPSCTIGREGLFAYATSDRAYYRCGDAKWYLFDAEGELEMSSSSFEPSYGKMTDSRDGQVYKTVKIGSQTWVAENLNYAYNEGSAQSYCYNSSADSCAKYGRLYIWSAAKDSAGLFDNSDKSCGWGEECSASSPVRGVCPEGWHLPSKADFEMLLDSVGGQLVAGKVLKFQSG